MAGRYKALAPPKDHLATPKSVAEAEAHEEHVAAMERQMKAKEKEQSNMLESGSNSKIPTLEGLRQAIDTTIRANMKEEIAKMPYKGMKSWDDVLPMEQQFSDFEAGGKNAGVAAEAKKETTQDTIKAESNMLTERQDAVANQEKTVASEKQMLKGQMVKVAQAANNLQDKFQDEEDEVKKKAQEKVHDASFAMDEAMREKTMAETDIKKSQLMNKEMKASLIKTVKSKMLIEAAAKHDLEKVKHEASLSESIALKRLKKLAQTKIHAMAKAASKIAKQLFLARDEGNRDKAEIKYLRSKILLQDKRNQRAQEKLARRIEAKESKFWNQQLTVAEKDANKEKLNLKQQLTKAEEEEAKVARSAVKSQTAMSAMKMPLAAQDLAKRMTFKARKSIKTLTTENELLKSKVAELEDDLMRAKRGSLKMKSTLQGVDMANVQLLKLVKKVNEKKQDAETAAEQNAQKVEIDEQRLADRKGHLDTANVTSAEFDRLLETPCSGSSCNTMANPDFNVEIPLISNTQLVFPDALTPT